MVARRRQLARLRGDLRVIDGETLLQKLSDYSRGNLNFATIVAHRTDVPLRHAWRHSFQQPGWQNSGGAIRVYNGCSCATPPEYGGGGAVARNRTALSFLARILLFDRRAPSVPTRARDAVARRPAQGWTRTATAGLALMAASTVARWAPRDVRYPHIHKILRAVGCEGVRCNMFGVRVVVGWRAAYVCDAGAGGIAQHDFAFART